MSNILMKSLPSLECEQLKTDLKRLVGKVRVNAERARKQLNFEAQSKWIGIECEMRLLLSELGGYSQ